MKTPKIKHTLKPSRHARAIERRELAVELGNRLICAMLARTETGEVEVSKTDLEIFGSTGSFTIDQLRDGRMRVKLVLEGESEPEETQQ